jgi:hypothetical protein
LVLIVPESYLALIVPEQVVSQQKNVNQLADTF